MKQLMIVLFSLASAFAGTVTYDFTGQSYNGVTQDFSYTAPSWITSAQNVAPDWCTGCAGDISFLPGDPATDDLIEIPAPDGVAYLYWFPADAFTTPGVYQQQYGIDPPGGYNQATLIVGESSQVPEPSGTVLAGLGLAALLGWATRLFSKRRKYPPVEREWQSGYALLGQINIWLEAVDALEKSTPADLDWCIERCLVDVADGERVMGVIENPFTRRLYAVAARLMATSRAEMTKAELEHDPERRRECQLMANRLDAMDDILRPIAWAAMRDEVPECWDVKTTGIRKGWRIVEVPQKPPFQAMFKGMIPGAE